MTFNIPKVLLPTIVGVSAYLIVKRFFPEKGKVKSSEKDPLKTLRGGSNKMKLIERIIKKIIEDERAIKIGLIALFATAGANYFHEEIEKLLVDNVFQNMCVRDVDGKLKVVCDIVQDHELNLHTKAIKTLLVKNNLTQEQKISLLKIKLDFIINGECKGRPRFLLVAILGAILAVTISGIGGLGLILEALYRLFKEGKIDEALYKEIASRLIE